MPTETEITPASTFFDRIRQNEIDFSSAYNNYEMCYINFNINDDTSNFKCSNIIGGGEKKNCNDCLKTSENIILQSLSDIQNIQNDIEKEGKKLGGIDVTPPQDVTETQKDDLKNVVNRYNTTHESLMDSVELYKTYRIHLVSEVIKLLVILFIIFYLLKTTKGIKASTFISVIVYITLSTINTFYKGYILFILSVLSFFIFVVFSIMNINDISINYRNIANKTAETLSNISTEFKKDVNVL
jgi:hypothetical protein